MSIGVITAMSPTVSSTTAAAATATATQSPVIHPLPIVPGALGIAIRGYASARLPLPFTAARKPIFLSAAEILVILLLSAVIRVDHVLLHSGFLRVIARVTLSRRPPWRCGHSAFDGQGSSNRVFVMPLFAR